MVTGLQAPTLKLLLIRRPATEILPEGATISTATQAIMKHKLDLLGQHQREIDEVAGDGKIDLAAKLRENPSLLKDIENFHNDAASQDPVTQLQNVRAKHPGRKRAQWLICSAEARSGCLRSQDSNGGRLDARQGAINRQRPTDGQEFARLPEGRQLPEE